MLNIKEKVLWLEHGSVTSCFESRPTTEWPTNQPTDGHQTSWECYTFNKGIFCLLIFCILQVTPVGICSSAPLPCLIYFKITFTLQTSLQRTYSLIYTAFKKSHCVQLAIGGRGDVTKHVRGSFPRFRINQFHRHRVHLHLKRPKPKWSSSTCYQDRSIKITRSRSISVEIELDRSKLSLSRYRDRSNDLDIFKSIV